MQPRVEIRVILYLLINNTNPRTVSLPLQWQEKSELTPSVFTNVKLHFITLTSYLRDVNVKKQAVLSSDFKAWPFISQKLKVSDARKHEIKQSLCAEELKYEYR